MKKISINLKFSFVLLIVYIATYVIDFLTAKSITIAGVGLCIGALVLLVLFFRKMKPMYYLGIAAFAFLSQYLGAMLNLYTIIPSYDFILHFSSGILLVFLADYFYELIVKKHPQSSIPQTIRLIFAFFISVASAAIWEIWEYAGDVLLGLQSQGGLDDTMTDIIAGTTGAVLGVVLFRFILQKSKKRTIA